MAKKRRMALGEVFMVTSWKPCYVTESLSVLALTPIHMGNSIYWSTDPLSHQFSHESLIIPESVSWVPTVLIQPLLEAHTPPCPSLSRGPPQTPTSLVLFSLTSTFYLSRSFHHLLLFWVVISFLSIQLSYPLAQSCKLFLKESDGKGFRLWGLNNLCWNYSTLLL